MEDKIKNELNENFIDFISSAEDDFNKGRFNPSVSSYFKAIAILCDLNIYQKVGLLPKNHSERFLYLKMHFKEVYELVSPLFNDYTDSYNKRALKENASKLKENVKKIKGIFETEKSN
ncbi:MAG: hypothetical protein KKC75_00805 [Nanoarchaeota archaeon]|nr:hypothetical protein [Nanoarchaeota archaeon]MBU1005654.1 hypothetical protein [Nanoarchaeota archaeon]MBU1946921.1 hypothetical protein [Nanoarchaeota archaeon]